MNPSPAAAEVASGLSRPISESEARLDFPRWIPPMLVKELRQDLRARGFISCFMGFQTGMLIAFFYAAVQVEGSEAFVIANNMFWGLMLVLLMIISPLRALGGLGGEIEGRTVDLLVLTRLTASRIVKDKWVSLIAQAALLSVSLLPYGVLRYYLGSVDLINDLGFMVELFAGCAVLTAIALWMSGFPQTVRRLLGLGMLPVLFILINMQDSGMFRQVGYGPSSSALGKAFEFDHGWSSALFGTALCMDSLLIIAFCLVQAARRLAPPAENHATATRVLALLGLVPPLLLAVGMESELARWHLLISGLILYGVCGMELARVAQPMRAQVRSWMNSPARWRARCGPFLLPGWPSAALFALIVLAAAQGTVFLVEALAVRKISFNPAYFAWWMGLGWVALVAPILLLTQFKNYARFSRTGYWIIQGFLVLQSVIMFGKPASGNGAKIFQHMVDFTDQLLPVSSFVQGINWVSPTANVIKPEGDFTPAVILGQLVVLILIILCYQILTRPYWKLVKQIASEPIHESAAPPA